MLKGIRSQVPVFGALVLLYILAYFYRVSLPVIAGDITRDTGVEAAALGTVSAALFLCFALAQLPLGPLLDRFGPRRLLCLFSFLTVAGSLVFAQADAFGGLVAGRALQGLGTAVVLMGALKVYATCFPPQRFATLSGLQVSLGNLGNLLATVPLAWASGLVGWRPVFVAMAILTLGAIVLIARLLPPHPSAEPSAGDRLPLFGGLRELLCRRDFWIFGALAFFWYGGYMSVQGLWGGPYVEKVLGEDSEGAARLLMMTALGFILGCPLCGYLSDRWFRSRKKVLRVAQLFLALLLGLFAGPLPEMPLWSRPAVFFFLGLAVSSGPLLYAQVKESFRGGMEATAMATLNFFVMLGAACVQTAMGLLVRVLEGLGPVEALQRAYLVPVLGLLGAWGLYLQIAEKRVEAKEASDS